MTKTKCVKVNQDNLPLYLFHQGTNFRAYDYLGAQAEYQKQGDAIFGVVHIYWGYLDASIMWGEMWKDKAAVFDHSYVLIYPDGKMVNCKSSLDVDKLIKEYQSQ